MAQSDLIRFAVFFAMRQEAEFIEFVVSGKVPKKEKAFDILTEATGKPWFPYGNLVNID